MGVVIAANVALYRHDVHFDATREGLNTPPQQLTDVADQPFFRDQRDSEAVAISTPLPTRTANESHVYFSRALRHPDGSFAGAVMVSVAGSYFVSGYESSRLGEAVYGPEDFE